MGTGELLDPVDLVRELCRHRAVVDDHEFHCRLLRSPAMTRSAAPAVILMVVVMSLAPCAGRSKTFGPDSSAELGATGNRFGVSPRTAPCTGRRAPILRTSQKG